MLDFSSRWDGLGGNVLRVRLDEERGRGHRVSVSGGFEFCDVEKVH